MLFGESGVRVLLYRTITGSRLYGTNRPDSDYDWIEVYSSMRHKPRQSIKDNDDTIRLSLSTFMAMASSGRHQMLEAMFAPKTDIDMFYDMRRSFYPDTAQTVNLYRRTIQAFGHRKSTRRDKAIKTALRMTYNLDEFLRRGRFDPVLDPSLAAVLGCMTYTEAATAVAARMNDLADQYGL